MLITLNGVDGCGQTTQIRLLIDWLNSKGKKTYYVKNYTDGPIGQLIRKIYRGKENVCIEAQALLFAADRIDSVKKEVEPALARGEIVICDRFYESNLATYYMLGLDTDFIDAIEQKCPKPDISIILDIPAEVGLKRKICQGGKKVLNIHDIAGKVEEKRQSFLKLAKERGWMVIDATPEIDKVQQQIRKIVGQKIGIKC